MAGALGALAFWRIDPNRLLACLGDVRPALLPLILLSLASLYALRALRWAWLLRPLRRLSVREVLPALMVGGLGDQCLPAHLGEILRVWAIHHEHRLSVAAVVSTIVLERLLDVLSIFALFAAVLPFLPAFPEIRILGGIAVGLGGFGMAVLLILCAASAWSGRWQLTLQGALRLLPCRVRARATDALHAALAGLAVLRSPRKLAVLLGLSLLQWIANSLVLYFTAASLSPAGSGLPVEAALLLTVAVVLGGLLPTAPGYLGTMQFCFVVALSPFGIPQERAIVASLYAIVVGSFPVVMVGGYYLLRLRSRLRPKGVAGRSVAVSASLDTAGPVPLS